MRVIAYAYDADHHCESCMLEYARNVPYHDYDFSQVKNESDIIGYHPGIIDLMKAVEYNVIRDSEGNPIHPVFDIDEWYDIGEGNQTLVCGDCLGVLDTYDEEE